MSEDPRDFAARDIGPRPPIQSMTTDQVIAILEQWEQGERKDEGARATDSRA